MKPSISILICLLVPWTIEGWGEGELEELKQKLYRKVRSLDGQHEELSRPIHEHRLSFNNSDVHLLSLFNLTLLSAEGKLYRISPNGSLDIYARFEHPASFFLITHEFLQTGFIAVSTKDEILIYTFTEGQESPEPSHSISSPASDHGSFFVNNGKLYLVSSNNATSQLTIYKWLGTYFDQILSIRVSGIVKFATFPSGEIEIIVALRSELLSTIYGFQSGKLKKMQPLDTSSPSDLNIFVQNNVPYMLVYEEVARRKAGLYKWNGFEMIFINTVNWRHRVYKSSVIYVNSTPLIIHPQPRGEIQAFRLSNKEIVLHESVKRAENSSVILDISEGANENSNITFMAVLKDDNALNIYGMSFKAPVEIEPEQENEALQNCFNNLKGEIYDKEKKLNQLNNSYGETVETIVPSVRKRQAVWTTDQMAHTDDIKRKLDQIKPILTDIQNAILTINTTTTVFLKGNITASSVKATNITVETVNGRAWNPESWLKYSEKQTIKGPLTARKIQARSLIAKGAAATIFENVPDFLRKRGDQAITGRVKIKHLEARKAHSNTINGIKADSIRQKGDSSPITGRKSFRNIQMKNFTVQTINNESAHDVLTRPKFASSIHVDRVEVRYIDGIDWQEWQKTVFNCAKDTVISGNLVVPLINVKRLTAPIVNGIESKNLLTKTTDQVVDSSIEFTHLRASRIDCRTINKMNISQALRRNQNATVVEGPIYIENLHVQKDLKVTTKDKELFSGTNGCCTGNSTMIQRYLGKVVVKGDLHVRNLHMLQRATLNFESKNYTGSVFEEYWTEDAEQIIPVHLVAAKGLSVAHLVTDKLNEVSMENFALKHQETHLTGPVHFKNISVSGNVLLHDNAPSPLKRIYQQGVWNDGRSYVIKGRKVFKGNLTVQGHVKGNVQSNWTTSDKAIKKLVIKGNLAGNISTASVNGLHFDNWISLHRPQNLTSLRAKDVTVKKLEVTSINGIKIQNYLDKLHRMMATKEFNRVRVTGNATLQEVHDLQSVNGQNISYLLLKELDDEVDFTGNLNFTDKVTIKNLKASVINDIDFESLTKRFFYKRSNQTVTGSYTFDRLKTVNLHARRINDKNLERIIDVTSERLQHITAPKVAFSNINFKKSLSAQRMVPCDINEVIRKIHYPDTREWSSIEVVKGNVTFTDTTSQLHRILEESVKLKEENHINAPVIMQGSVFSERVKAEGEVNGLNLTELIEDVILRESESEQVITGRKTFQNIIDANTIIVQGNADVLAVNRISIPNLYERLIKKDQSNNLTIAGEKVFLQGFRSDRFTTKQISGVQPNNIVSSSDTRRIPKASFENLHVANNLNVRFINNTDFNYFLNNRVYVDASKKQILNGVYYLDSLEVIDLQTESINEIKVSDIIFDLGTQKIAASKSFLEDVAVEGNLIVTHHINQVNLTEAYDRAVLHGTNPKSINGSLTLLKPVTIRGNIAAQSINHYPVDKMKQVANRLRIDVDKSSISKLKQQIEEIVQTIRPTVLKHIPNDLMYIEKLSDITIENAINAKQTVVKRPSTILDIFSKESHEKCNLPEGCACFNQHTLYNATPPVISNDRHRIYRYKDGSMKLQVVTNGVSYNKKCSSLGNATESTHLTWSVNNSAEQTQTLFTSGYVSDVEFFTVNEATYAVINRFYDTTNDSHQLDCLVMRLSSQNKDPLEVQKIPTHGAWSVYLLRTMQGMHLIIGNLRGNTTEIYRFDQAEEKFVILRTIPHAYPSVAGVVLGPDSLIVATDTSNLVQILKYKPEWDNYYHYEAILLEESVRSVSVFYMGDSGTSEAYLCVLTDQYYRIYYFQYVDGWNLEMMERNGDFNAFIPFTVDGDLYVFAASTGNVSSLLRVVKYGEGV